MATDFQVSYTCNSCGARQTVTIEAYHLTFGVIETSCICNYCLADIWYDKEPTIGQLSQIIYQLNDEIEELKEAVKVLTDAAKG